MIIYRRNMTLWLRSMMSCKMLIRIFKMVKKALPSYKRLMTHLRLRMRRSVRLLRSYRMIMIT